MDYNKEEATKARGIAEEMMEKDDVPEGSFELDLASLPTYQLVPNQVREPEFYKFADERSLKKFQIGQFWAIYIDGDTLPRYYGQIKKIDLLHEFVLHVPWFYACPLPKSTIRWHDKTMLIGCGLFKFRNSKLNKYTVTNNFSHVVAAKPLKKGVFKIFARTGEVWAVYKNWSAQLMKGNNLENFEYKIVEIVNVSDNYVDVKFLALVKGFKSVYIIRVEEEETDKVVKICVSEHLRFSHQIPDFRLTKEKGGSLRGFSELDPLGMPMYLLCTD
uniref:DNAJ heat shock N-terminal domain-containing protein n=1 Tax=Solanum tuberosum TaxID=4113 RepID=M1DVA6_SOLTU